MQEGIVVRYKNGINYGKKPLGRVVETRRSPLGRVVTIQAKDGKVIKALEKNLEVCHAESL